MKTLLSRLSKKEDGAGAIEAMVLLAMAILVLIFLNSMWEWIKSPYSARMVDLAETINGIGKTKPMGSSPTLSPSTPGNQPGAPVQIPLDPPSVKPGGPGSQQPPEGPPTQIVPAIPLPLPDPMAPGPTEPAKPTTPPGIPTVTPGPTVRPKTIEERLSELHPDLMKSIDDKVFAYRAFSDLLAENGNHSKFSNAASIVSDQIYGLFQNNDVYFFPPPPFPPVPIKIPRQFGEETQEYLAFVNDQLYRVNYPIFCEMVRNPTVYPDPFRFLPPHVARPNGYDGVPYDSLSFDRRMVRAEQAVLSYLNNQLKGLKKEIVMRELDNAFSLDVFPWELKDSWVSYVYGHSSTEWVREALAGRPISFLHESTRVALGQAMIYYLHGYNKVLFFDYKAKDPTFPKYSKK